MSAPSVIAIERIIDIFEAFQLSQRPLSLTELSELTGIPKSTCCVARASFRITFDICKGV